MNSDKAVKPVAAKAVGRSENYRPGSITMTEGAKIAISQIHYGYVRELSKIEFLTTALDGMVDSLGPLSVNLAGFVLAMSDAITGLHNLNDELDKAGRE